MSKPILIQEVESKALQTYVDSQDTSLSNSIKVLNNDRGYLTSAKVTNLDDLKTNGKYSFSGVIDGVTGTYAIDVIESGGTWLQEATITWGGSGVIRGRKLYRWFVDSSWQRWKQIATTDVAMTKLPVLRDTDLKEYIKNLEQSCTFYVHNSCTNTPMASRFFICQVYCHTNQARYSDKHIEIQEYTSKRQFYADSWNKENFVWKEYATLEKAEILPVLETGLTLVYNDTYKVNNMIFINVRLKKTDGSSFAQNTRLELCSFPVNKVIQTQCATLSCFRSVEWTSGYGIIYANGSSAKIRAYVDGASDVKEIVIGGVIVL